MLRAVSAIVDIGNAFGAVERLDPHEADGWQVAARMDNVILQFVDEDWAVTVRPSNGRKSFTITNAVDPGNQVYRSYPAEHFVGRELGFYGHLLTVLDAGGIQRKYYESLDGELEVPRLVVHTRKIGLDTEQADEFGAEQIAALFWRHDTGRVDSVRLVDVLPF